MAHLTAERFTSHFREHKAGSYFRFNLEKELSELCLKDYGKQNLIQGMSEQYLNKQQDLLEKCVYNLQQRSEVFLFQKPTRGSGEISCSESASNQADEWLQRFDKEVIPFLSANSECDRVKIAVIDTGIDSKYPMVKRNRNRIRESRSFVPGGHTSDTDVDRHGTCVASLILRVAPEAELYVAKVAEDSKTLGSSAASHIAEAISMATNDWKVDIINISLGYSGYVSELRCIQHEIMRAYSRGILVFCAAGNPGGNDNIAYPASMRTVICVNSANGEGLPSASNPPADLQDNFTILGEEIPIGSATGIQRVTGTSFASPIAAGLCAFIIRFLREAEGFPREQREDNEYLLKNCQGIRAVFLVMSSEIQGFDYIRPWELFKGNNKDRTVWHIQHALETLKAH